jgi:hypothetical protein
MKKISLPQEKILGELGLAPSEWERRFEDESYLHLVHKSTREIAIIDKATEEIVARRK